MKNSVELVESWERDHNNFEISESLSFWWCEIGMLSERQKNVVDILDDIFHDMFLLIILEEALIFVKKQWELIEPPDMTTHVILFWLSLHIPYKIVLFLTNLNWNQIINRHKRDNIIDPV